MRLLSLFKPKKNYLELLVIELKQDKERLIQEVQELKKELKEQQIKTKENTETHKEFNFTKLELKIINCIETKNPKNLNELALLTTIKKSSLNVYLSKLRVKGYNISYR